MSCRRELLPSDAFSRTRALVLCTVAGLVPALGIGVPVCIAAPADGPARSRLEVQVLVPNARGSEQRWHFTTTRPADDWMSIGFDHSGWKTGLAGFGTAGTPNTHVRTEWNGTEIWLRRSFTLAGVPAGEVFLTIHHDEDATIWLNGVKAAELTGWSGDCRLAPLSDEARETLRPGKNTLAVHCRQTSGGQYIDVGMIGAASDRWSRQQALDWYRGQAWPCGFNYVPANAISYTEMWMEYSFDPGLIDRELKLAREIGFNCLRVVLPFVVWEHDPSAFKQRMSEFLDICQRHGLRVMPTLFDDCVFGPITDPVCGRQPDVVVGWYANGWTPSPGHGLVRDVTQWPRLERYVRDVVGRFRDDPRVWVWDLYNEPTNGGIGDVSIPLMDRVFDCARDVAPSQPLTVGLFRDSYALNSLALLRSDIVTFHNYNPAGHLAAEIAWLKTFGRPVICTEWLNRPLGSTVEDCLPVFEKTDVGCMLWGLVNGKTQTHLSWGHRPGQPEPPVWQHDLFYGDYRPYAPRELDLFRAAIQRMSGSAQVGRPSAGGGRP